MILEKNEIDARLSDPNNLMNRLRRLTGQPTEIISIPSEVKDSISDSRNQHPSLPPSVDELVDDLSEKLATAKCRSGAREVLEKAIEGLKVRVYEVDDPVKLSRIATDMGKVVNGFDNDKKDKPSTAIPIIYRPVMLTENNFQIIHAQD